MKTGQSSTPATRGGNGWSAWWINNLGEAVGDKRGGELEREMAGERMRDREIERAVQNVCGKAGVGGDQGCLPLSSTFYRTNKMS